MSLNWKIIKNEIINSVFWFHEHGIIPSLRSIFYRLVSLRIIPNTKTAYKRLSAVTVELRKNNKLPWNSISDESRLVIKNFDERYIEPIKYVDDILNVVKDAHNQYKIPKWHNQPHYVEVWIEKQALANAVQSFLKDKQVVIVINKGYAGWTFLYKNCNRLKKIKMQGKTPHILYFGDFDPSGADMDRHLSTALSTFRLSSIDIHRVAITPKQIKTFNLPPIPSDQETINKLNKDTRKSKFILKYGGLYAVELDALLAIAPDEFEKLLIESVDQFFDKTVYEQNLKQYSSNANEIQKMIKTKIKNLNF